MKKDEINKGSIIIGIGAFAIIAIVIIAAISFFSPKSHAQVVGNNFDAFAVSTFHKSNQKSQKDGFKHECKNFKNQKDVFKTVSFAKEFKAFNHKTQFAEKLATFKDEYKPTFTFAFAHAKDAEKFFSTKSFVKYEKNFKVESYFEKEKQS